MQKFYPDNFELKIGFDRIREMLHQKCLSNMGHEWVEEMHFKDDFENISRELGETDEFCRIVREFDHFPSDHFFDLRPALEKIRIEGRFLDVQELFDMKRSLESIRSIVLFFSKQPQEIFPLLNAKTKNVQLFPYIYDRIDSIINKFGKIRDNATPELGRIRNDILSKQASMSRRLHAILKIGRASCRERV